VRGAHQIGYARRMVGLGHAVRYSFGEYLAHERVSNTRHEFLDGQIFAMAGGSPEHSALIAAFAAHLANAVRGGRCRVHMSDLRVRVSATGLTTYPDVAVICGPWQRDAADEHTVVNPTLLVEVLSPTTEAYDRGEKLEHYKRIDSLRACALVAPDRHEVELWTRSADGPWARALLGPGAALELAAIGARLDLDAVFLDAREPT
jgi:Uma2 family endonuclease